jgi:hypothetical protein
MTSNRITSSTFEGWMPVAEEAQTKGMEIEACWEGDPARITRVSVRGDRTGDASDDAVRRVLRAYGVADGVALSWEAGEGEDEQVAFVSELLECEHE